MPVHALPPRARRGGVALAIGLGLAFVVTPAAAQAAPVDLGTAAPFVVLGGSTVTNTGPSVLDGDLGVAPGTSLVGFGLPAVVNGATHANDAVATQAQADLTTAYDVAAGQPVAPADDLTGTDLGSRTLRAGAYRFASSAQLTGALTLDAEGDPAAQFVFEIGSTLTTASASSVVLVNGASPCNVFWQVGSSATLDTTTAFQGNLMALSDISLNDGASVIGRVLARNGQISLINNVLDGSACTAPERTPPGTTPPPATTPPASTGPDTAAPGAATPGAATPGAGPQDATAPDVRPAPARTGMPADQLPSGSRTTPATRSGTATLRRTPGAASRRCTDGFSAIVRGRHIRRVVFQLDGRTVRSRARSPFQVTVKAPAGRHILTARVTFGDATRSRTLKLRYRACAAALLQPASGPSQFTG